VINAEFERIWKEAVAAYFKILLGARGSVVG
jgi:hypothetical protein